MDVFFEQLVPIPKNGKIILLQTVMWLAGIMAAITIVFGFALYLNFILPIGVALAFGLLYLCYRWSGNFSCEFEYIFTNGDLDIDKIIAQQKRERKITINVEETESLFKYKKELIDRQKYNKVIVACVPNEDSVCLVARTKKDGLCLLIFSPEEKMINKIKEFIPRNILRTSEI